MTADDRSEEHAHAVQVGVGALIFNTASQVFLAQRGPAARNERGSWDCPGGAVNFGERLIDAVKRECLEEHGIVIDELSLLTVIDHIIAEEDQHWVAVIYFGTYHSGTPVIREPEKCSAIGWFDLTRLPYPLSRTSRDALVAYDSRQHTSGPRPNPR
jgi:mutator protein MutT